jgi:hypothetical protein
MNEAIHMAKQLIKQVFGQPSAEVIGRIGSSDQVTALHAAHYRYGAHLSDLERQFEAKASELRESYLAEVIAIHDSEE